MTSLHAIDATILAAYLVMVVAAGIVFSQKASVDIDSYFLGGRSIPWWALGVSNAASMYDITGTMWMVTLFYVYGVKSIWIPWIWPTFNQIFMMVFLSAWLRRSGVLTGAEWLKTRFGKGVGLQLAHLSVVLFALVTVIAFIAYAFVGAGKFAAEMLPWEIAPSTYATVILSVTTLYVVTGGMYSVVVTDLIQFALLTVASVLVAIVAFSRTTTTQIAFATPEGWSDLWFGWRVGVDWEDRLPAAAEAVRTGGYELFAPFLGMALFKGILASIAGPTPGYDMQRILAAKDEREASLMNAIVSPVLFMPRYLLIASVGVLALVSLPRPDAGADLENLLPSVIAMALPAGVIGVLLAGLLAAFMSTFDSTVNAGAAYLVNDVYKRYLHPDASSRRLVIASYVASVLVVIAGMAAGLSAGDINAELQWIAAGLYGGYVAPNVLKWVWWRLNGAGYFAGMVTGVALSLLIARADDAADWLAIKAPAWNDAIELVAPYLTSLWLFPLLLVASGLAAVGVSLATPVGDLEVLKSFYRNVRPWGVWGPIRQLVQADDPSFVATERFGVDMVNCAIGMAWQIALCATPVYLVLRDWSSAAISFLVVVVTTLALKRFWYDQLPKPTPA